MEVLLEEEDRPPPRAHKSVTKARTVRKTSAAISMGVTTLEDIPSMASSMPSLLPKRSTAGATLKEDIDALFPVDEMILPNSVAAKKKAVKKKVVKKKVVRPKKSTPVSSVSVAQNVSDQSRSKNPYSFFNSVDDNSGDSHSTDRKRSSPSMPSLPSLSDDELDSPPPPTANVSHSSHQRSESASRTTVLPSLGSDSDDDTVSPTPVRANAPKASSGLELPDLGLGESEEELDDLDDLDDLVPMDGPPVEENLEYWRKRAIGAEIESEKATKRAKKHKQELINAKKIIQKLRLKEKEDAEQMEAVLHQLESNLQQSRAGYQAQIVKLNKQLEAAKVMVQHLQQADAPVELPENFQEYYDFLVTGKRQAMTSADRIHTLASKAEIQLKQLIGGCNALKDVADALRTIDTFADPPSMPK